MRSRICARSMRPASCASAQRSCVTARSNGARVPVALSAPGRPPLRAALARKARSSRRAKRRRFRSMVTRRSGNVRRANQPRNALGKRALRVGARAARDRREHDAEQRAGDDDLASLGQLDRRSRAGARLRAPHATAAGALARASRNASRFVGRGADRRERQSPSRCPRAAGATISRCSASADDGSVSAGSSTIVVR